MLSKTCDHSKTLRFIGNCENILTSKLELRAPISISALMYSSIHLFFVSTKLTYAVHFVYEGTCSYLKPRRKPISIIHNLQNNFPLKLQALIAATNFHTPSSKPTWVPINLISLQWALSILLHLPHDERFQAKQNMNLPIKCDFIVQMV